MVLSCSRIAVRVLVCACVAWKVDFRVLRYKPGQHFGAHTDPGSILKIYFPPFRFVGHAELRVLDCLHVWGALKCCYDKEFLHCTRTGRRCTQKVTHATASRARSPKRFSKDLYILHMLFNMNSCRNAKSLTQLRDVGA